MLAGEAKRRAARFAVVTEVAPVRFQNVSGERPRLSHTLGDGPRTEEAEVDSAHGAGGVGIVSVREVLEVRLTGRHQWARVDQPHDLTGDGCGHRSVEISGGVMARVIISTHRTWPDTRHSRGCHRRADVS